MGSEKNWVAMTKKKDWKNLLLSSGVPLEYSIKSILENLGIDRPSEFSYIKRNEYGQDITFSVDIYANKLLHSNIFLEFFVECKYRHDNVKWIFTPSKYEVFFGPEFRDIFIILDHCNEKLKINSEEINEFHNLYDLCGKGIEILPNASNPEGIKRGIYQLKYCIVHKIVDSLKHQINKWLGSKEHCFILVPILVTTAQLWRMKEGATLEGIRESEDIEEICEKKDILLLHEEPNPTLIGHTLEHIMSNLTQGEMNILDEKLKKNWREEGLRFYMSYVANNFPSMFLIINYSRFEKAIKNCVSFFQTHSFLKQL